MYNKLMESEEKPDKKHRDMLNEFIKEKIEQGYKFVGSEIIYSYYGKEGSIDVILKNKEGNRLFVCELKPKLVDLGKAIRQVKRAKEFFVNARPEFSKFKEIDYLLVLKATRENLEMCTEYINLIRGIDVLFWHINKERQDLANSIYKGILDGRYKLKPKTVTKKLCMLCKKPVTKWNLCYDCYKSIGARKRFGMVKITKRRFY